jgi:hypothetical protein
MIEIRDQEFSTIDRGGLRSDDPTTFIDCRFQNCALSLTTNPGMRSEVSNLSLVGCSAHQCDVGPAILRNIRIDSLNTSDLLIIWGAVFDRVKISGPIGKLKINQFVHPSQRSKEVQEPFDRHRVDFYRSVDWALDISEARFKEFDLRGVPARLIRRDPETQVVVTRDRAAQPGWREALSATNTLWPFAIDLFLSDGDEDMVLVAPMGAAKAKRDALLGGLRELRRLGVAEPA